MRKVVLILIGFLIPLYGSFLDAGATFLTIFPGSRATALGNAFSALGGDATAPYYNPGLIAFFKKPEVIFQNIPVPFSPIPFFLNLSSSYLGYKVSHKPKWLPNLADNMYYQFAGMVYPVSQDLSFSLWGSYLTPGPIEATDYAGNVIRRWRPYDVNISFSAGYLLRRESIPFGMELGVGGTIKFIYSYIGPSDISEEVVGVKSSGKASTFTMDLGIVGKGPYDILRGSFSYQNIFGGLNFDGETAPLPKLFRYGIALKPLILFDISISKKITDIFDLILVIDWIRDNVGDEHEIWEASGIEFSFFKTLYIRSGSFKDIEGERVGNTIGVGFHLDPFKFDVSNDGNIYSPSEKNFRVSLSFIGGYGENLSKNKALIASLLIPGGGQMLRGEFLKGCGFLTLGTVFWNGILRSGREELRILNLMGLWTTHIVSLLLL
jgi:hypothetical protein